MTTLSRRNLIAGSLSAPLLGTVSGCATRVALDASGAVASADDEAFWASVAARYEVTDAVTNVENGNWGLMAHPVLDAYIAHTEQVNRDNSYFARREYGPIWRNIVGQVTSRLGAQDGEVAFTRGATEALQSIIGGYNRLRSKDAVMFADLDYGSIMAAMRWRANKSGAETVELAIPEPSSHGALIDFYTEAFERHANTRLLLLTHISHRTGLLMPVREISEIARARGIDVVVDAAHSWGQIDFEVTDLGADFVGFNLHKWMGAPIGVGAMYIRADRLSDIDPNLSASSFEFDRIEGRVHTGTSNLAAFLTVPDAFAFQDLMGSRAKEARLRHLRDAWVSECRDVEGLEILTPEDDRLHAGITSFRLRGLTRPDQNQAIAAYLHHRHGVFTVHRTGIANGSCVRVTPGYYNSTADMRRAASAILDARAAFLSA